MCAGFNTACPSPPNPWAGPVKMETVLLELEIFMFHFSLRVSLVCLKSGVLLFIVYVVLSTAEMNCFLNLF